MGRRREGRRGGGSEGRKENCQAVASTNLPEKKAGSWKGIRRRAAARRRSVVWAKAWQKKKNSKESDHARKTSEKAENLGVALPPAGWKTSGNGTMAKSHSSLLMKSV